MEDRVEKFPGNSDDGLTRTAPGFDAFVEVARIGAVFLGNQCALHQFGAGGSVAALGDRTDMLAIVGLVDTRRNAEVRGQFAGVGKV